MSGHDPRALRAAFGTFLTGVTVVTANDEDGTPVGFTANSYTSVSMDPALLLVCPARRLNSFAIFARCERFAVSILAEDQQRVSNVFATSTGDRFAEIPWHAGEGGCALIDHAAAHLSCRTHQRVEAGDHLVLIGEVDAFAASGRPGLGYANGGYFSLGLERRAESVSHRTARTVAGAVIEHDGCVLVEEGEAGHRLPKVTVPRRSVGFEALSSLFARAGVAVEIGAVYSVYDDTVAGDTYTFYRGTASQADARGLGRFVSAADVAALSFELPAEKAMLERYALEREFRDFGLYVGDESRGAIQRLGEGVHP